MNYDAEHRRMTQGAAKQRIPRTIEERLNIPPLHSKEFYEERMRLENEMTPMQKRLYGLLRDSYHEESSNRFHRAAWEVKALYDQIRAE